MIMDQSLRELYQEVILDHSRHPRHFGTLEHPTHKAEGYNPLCGDKVSVMLVLDADGRVADIKFTGKGAILSFEAEGMHAHDLATILDREGVAVRAGHHCAQPLMERFGVASTSRASFALYNTRADVDALIAGLHKARQILG